MALQWNLKNVLPGYSVISSAISNYNAYKLNAHYANVFSYIFSNEIWGALITHGTSCLRLHVRVVLTVVRISVRIYSNFALSTNSTVAQYSKAYCTYVHNNENENVSRHVRTQTRTHSHSQCHLMLTRYDFFITKSGVYFALSFLSRVNRSRSIFD